MSAKRVVVAGGTGLVGTVLTGVLIDEGYDPVLLSRNEGLRNVVWDGITLGDWVQALEGAEAVVNLSGSPINVKFNDSNRRRIIESRSRTTRLIGDAILKCENPPKLWLNASAVGYYGHRKNEPLDESSSVGTGFLADTCAAWERVFFDHPAQVRKAAIRIGIVLSRNGGALKPLETVVKLFLGGAVGNGRQGVSWIHERDLARLMVFIIEKPELSGPFNGTAPNPISNDALMEGLRWIFGRPQPPNTPGFVMRLMGKVIGPDASLVMDGAYVYPRKAQEAGFTFEFPFYLNNEEESRSALIDLYKRS